MNLANFSFCLAFSVIFIVGTPEHKRNVYLFDMNQTKKEWKNEKQQQFSTVGQMWLWFYVDEVFMGSFLLVILNWTSSQFAVNVFVDVISHHHLSLFWLEKWMSECNQLRTYILTIHMVKRFIIRVHRFKCINGMN